MASVVALVLLLLASSSCSTVTRDEEQGLNQDFVISKIADHIIIQKPDEINESPFNKVRRYLKVVPFKDSKSWDGDFVSKQENNVPIAVILAQQLKDDDRHEESDNLETSRNSENENKNENNIDNIDSTEIIPIAETRLDDIEAVGSKQAYEETGITNEVSDILEPSVRDEGHWDLFQDDNDISKSIEKSKEFEFENYDRAGNDNTDSDSNVSQRKEMDIIFKTISDGNDIQNKESSKEEKTKVNDFDMESNDLLNKVNYEYMESSEISQNRKKYLIIKEYSLPEDGLEHNHYSLNFVFN